MKLSIVIAMLVLTVLALAQAPPRPLDYAINSPTLARNIVTETPRAESIRAAAIQPGTGILVVTAPGQPTRVAADLGLLAHRTDAPTRPGSCDGSAAWATDAAAGFLYVCIVTPAGPVWARAPMTVNW